MMEVEGPVIVTSAEVSKVHVHPAPLTTLPKDRYDYSEDYSGKQRDDGPANEPVYTDCVRTRGINIGGAPGVKADPTKAYFAEHLESKFYQPGIIGANGDPVPFVEYFFTFVPVTSTVNYRPFMMVATHDGSFIQSGFNVDSFFVGLPGGQPQIEADLRPGQKTVAIHDGIKFSFTVNNVPVAYQRNAADTASIKLPYVNGSDQIVVERPLTSGNDVTAEGPTLQARGANTVSARLEAPDANASMAHLSCGKAATKKTAVLAIDSANNLVWAQGGVGGSQYFDFNASVIWRSRAGYTKAAELSNTSMQFNVPVRSGVYTMATLPNAVTAGLGAEIVVSNHPAGIVKAMSDGTSWRALATLGGAL